MLTFYLSFLYLPLPCFFWFSLTFFLRFPQAQALSTELPFFGHDLKVILPLPGWVLPYMTSKGMCRWTGCGFVPAVLNRVYNFAQDCPKQSNKIEGFVLNRVCVLGIFCPKQGQGLKPSAAHLYPNFGEQSSSICLVLVESPPSPGSFPCTSTFSKVILPLICVYK